MGSEDGNSPSTQHSLHSTGLRTRRDAGWSLDPYNVSTSRRLQVRTPHKTTKEIFGYQSHRTPKETSEITTVPASAATEPLQTSSWKPLFYSILGAIGVVYGDLSTSPIYTPNAIYEYALKEDKLPTKAEVIGYTSTMIWLIIIVVCIKYCYYVMFADYNSEGGSFAVYEKMKKYHLKPIPTIILTILSCASACLLTGDCIITPAISVLSSLEGITLVQPKFADYIVEVAVLILFVLYAIQCYGTKMIGKLFGPMLFGWISSMLIIGIWNLRRAPEILIAFSPWETIKFWFVDGNGRFMDLSNLVLTVTGCEAMFADMGHFGRNAILYAWWFFLLPATIFQYLGGSAFLLESIKKHPNNDGVGYAELISDMKKSIFWTTIPRNPIIYYLILVLASFGTIAASQAVISGAFTIMSEASQLKFLPRIRIDYTNPDEKGQVYVGVIALAEGFLAILMVVIYQHSVNLAAAYGAAVTSVSLLTTFLVFCYVAPYCWGYSKYLYIPLLVFFMIIDSLLCASTITKFVQGAWMTFSVAALIGLIMAIWVNTNQKIRGILTTLSKKEAMPLHPIQSPSVYSSKATPHKYLETGASQNVEDPPIPQDYRYVYSFSQIMRCKGLGIFLTGSRVIEHSSRPDLLSGRFETDEVSLVSGVSDSSAATHYAPLGLSRIVSRFKVLPEYVLLVNVETLSVPFIDEDQKVLMEVIHKSDRGIVCGIQIFNGWAEPLDSLNIIECLKLAAKNEDTHFPLEIKKRLCAITAEEKMDIEKFSTEHSTMIHPEEAVEVSPQSYMVKLPDGTIEPLSIFVSRKLIQSSVTSSRYIGLLVRAYNNIKSLLEDDVISYLHLPPDNTTEVGIAVTIE